MKILSIGNSFSQDAQRYLHRIAEANGHDLKSVNLFIGGCPLRKHYLNMLDDERAYSFEFNGEATGLSVSIREALKSDTWDYITLQQASHESFDFNNYTPYLEKLADFVHTYCPKTEILLHQTWAYEDGSEKLAKMGFDSTEEMFAKIKQAYASAAELLGGARIIPCGQAMLNAFRKSPEIVYRDTYHANLGFGRYLLALTWYNTLLGKQTQSLAPTALDEDVSEADRKLAEEIAKSV